MLAVFPLRRATMDIAERFAAINAKPSGDTFKPHKPLLLLIALSWARLEKPRLAPFLEYEAALKSFQDLFGNLVAIFGLDHKSGH
jgi:hypothetical protein